MYIFYTVEVGSLSQMRHPITLEQTDSVTLFLRLISYNQVTVKQVFNKNPGRDCKGTRNGYRYLAQEGSHHNGICDWTSFIREHPGTCVDVRIPSPVSVWVNRSDRF